MSYLSVLARHVLRDHESSSGVYEVINKLVNILPWYLFELWRESDILPVGSQEDENPGEQFVELAVLHISMAFSSVIACSSRW